MLEQNIVQGIIRTS